ncbi:MAG: carbohydrate ABC transporter permease [Spirochaetales bacterium]|nr:carbohydrate ABC transporter permease [Spirochaetales bacterium]
MKKSLKNHGLRGLGIFLALGYMFPLYIVLVNSFKKPKGIFINTLSFPGEYGTFENYVIAFKKMSYMRSFMNSLGITFFSVVFILLLGLMAAWMLVRTKNKTSTVIFYVFVTAMLIPFQSVMLPLVNTMGRIGFLNPPGLIFMNVGFSISLAIIFFHGFIKNVPVALEEAAVMEGASPPRILFLIISPLLKPIIMTVAILNIMRIWNDYLLPVLIINKKEWRTIPLMVAAFFGEYSKAWNLALAGLVLTIIPVVLFYIFSQKSIVKGLIQGAVK